MNAPLSFDAFRRLLAELLEVDETRVLPEAYFITDLGVDSLHMLNVLLHLERMGLKVTLEMAWQIQTVADAYQLYLGQVSRGEPGQAAQGGERG